MTQIVGDLDLDSGEFGPPEGEAEELSSQQTNSIMSMLVNKALAPEPVASVVEPYMLDVEKRMDIARYFQEILKAPLFATACEASEIVEKKMRDFARSQLEELVGIKTNTIEVVKSPFSEQEVATLKSLAKLSKNEILTLNLILNKVLSSSDTKPESSVTAPKVKPTPVLVARKTAVPLIAPISTPTTAVQTPVAPKRKPGRPPATIQVEDPQTGETIEMRVPKMRTVKNPNALAMPTGAALYMATAIASQNSAAAINRTANKAIETGNDFHAKV